MIPFPTNDWTYIHRLHFRLRIVESRILRRAPFAERPSRARAARQPLARLSLRWSAWNEVPHGFTSRGARDSTLRGFRSRFIVGDYDLNAQNTEKRVIGACETWRMLDRSLVVEFRALYCSKLRR